MDHLRLKKEQQVPLVIYKGGERIEIGMAIVRIDGSIEAKVAKDVRADIKEILFADLGDISMNPKLPPDLTYNTYFSNKTSDPVETVVIPPLKIQE